MSMSMIKEVMVTEKKVYEIPASHAAKLMQLVDYVFKMEGKGLDGAVAVDIAGELLSVTDRLRMQGAHDPEATHGALLESALCRALIKHMGRGKKVWNVANPQDVAMVVGTLSRFDGKWLAISAAERDTLREVERSGAFKGVAALADLNAKLGA